MKNAENAGIIVSETIKILAKLERKYYSRKWLDI